MNDFLTTGPQQAQMQQFQGQSAADQGIVAGYAPLPGAPDELMGPDGRVRPVWTQLVQHLNTLDAETVQRRFARGDRYLRDAGVYFRQYDEDSSSEREWPLSHVPVLIEQSEWDHISAGLIQRANLLERVAADLYGRNHLIADGKIPASLIAQSPEWLRPMVGVNPVGGHFLNFVAFEIGRGPQGNWWVLGDRTQAPSGAGFALENRVATSHVFADLFANANVHRLAGFFRQFRAMLTDLRPNAQGHAAILTPGLMNDTYFEHAYIARYLGLLLLEGEDLTLDGDRLMVRTVGGQVPVSVLWRRLDSQFCDPLELDETSSIGTPGILRALRAGKLGMVNMPGAGVLETRALLAFLPKLAKRLVGEDLILPNIATWWCGEESARQHVLDHADQMVLAPAQSTGLPYFPAEADRKIDPAWLALHGMRTIAQEAVTLSTTPVYDDGKLTPRPMCLRVFLARTADGWQVMPGGFARIGHRPDASAIAMQRGGSVADVWIVSDQPVDAVTTLRKSADSTYARPNRGGLPSRAADNLFWLGRYVERVEYTLRLLRSYHRRFEESGGRVTPLMQALSFALQKYGCDPSLGGPQGLFDMLNQTRDSAAKVRDRFSPDGWAALRNIAEGSVEGLTDTTPGNDMVQALGDLLRQINGFTGLLHENMYRFNGWRFLGIGRALERMNAMLGPIETLIEPDAPPGALDLLLELADSVMTYRRRYAMEADPRGVLDLLVLDQMNPRSVVYQLAQVQEHLRYMPDAEPMQHLTPLQKSTTRLHTELITMEPDDLSSLRLFTLREDVRKVADLVSQQYFG